MKTKSIVAAIVSVSLMASPALAQSSEESTPWAAWLVAAGVLAGFVLMALEDDDGDEPASP